MEVLWKYFDKIYILTDNKNEINQIEKNLKYVGIKKYDVVKFESKENVEKKIDKAVIKKKIFDISSRINIIEMVNKKICNKRCKYQKNKVIEIIKKAYNEKYNNILILKGDCRFKNYNYIKYLKTITWLSQHEWDIFYFGYGQWPLMMSFFVNNTILKLLNPKGTYAYSLSKSGIYKLNKILSYNNIEHNELYDLNKLYNNKHLKKYGVFPCIAYGKESDTLDKIYEEYNIKFKLKTINCVSEYVSVSTPFLILLIIIMICWVINNKK